MKPLRLVRPQSRKGCATIGAGQVSSRVHWNRTIAGGGLLGALIVAGAIVLYNWGATPRLTGEITDVRTLGMDADSSVAIINFEATNSSNYELSINRREMAIIDSEGSLVEGRS